MNSYDYIVKVLNDHYGAFVTCTLSHNEESVFGDYATNVAFALAKHRGVSSKECATQIVQELGDALCEYVEKIEVAGPGFVNFFLKDEVVRRENTGVRDIAIPKYAGKNILVEHSSLNLFKPFTIGHLVNNFIGEFASRAAKSGGANLVTMSFPSDVSLGIAKAIFIIKEDGGIPNSLIQKSANLIEYLGESYRRGVIRYEEDESSQAEIKKISNDIYDWSPGEVFDIYSYAKKENIQYFLHVLEGLGSHFDETIYESEAGHRGSAIVKANLGEGKVFIESEGAVVYVPSEERKDINTSVFINREGHPTYEAKDIGLLDLKFARRSNGFVPDLSLTITDAEQISHFKIVFDAASKLEGEWPERVSKSIHVPHGRMLFKGQKMSSRLGGVPLALEVISVVEEEVRERAGEKIAHLDAEERAKLEREIALSALRIAVLRSKPGININFDPETSLSFEGDSGPYLLYTHARCVSLLEKRGGIVPTWSTLEVTSLEKKLLHFEQGLASACEDLAPQKLVSYLFSAAQAFNSYYASTQILVEGDTEGNAHRLMVVRRTQEVLKRGLYVLGIHAPERM